MLSNEKNISKEGKVNTSGAQDMDGAAQRALSQTGLAQHLLYPARSSTI